MRQQIGACGTPALALVLRDLVQAYAFLVLAVEIAGNRQPGLPCRFQIACMEGAVTAQIAHMQRPLVAVPAVAVALVVFAEDEIGQHLVIRPAGVAERRPVVVIVAVAADVDHRVDGRGAAQTLAAWLVGAPPVQAGLRHAPEGPVVVAGGQHGDCTAGDVHHRPATATAGLQQADAGAGILAQASGQHGAGRTAADHDVVKFHAHACSCLRCGGPQFWLNRTPVRLL